MAAAIPAQLKAGTDVVRFANRAAQLEKFKPAISYWCQYMIVQKIIAKGLHTADEACMDYTTGLMDKLERLKTANPDNDAIVDDVAAKVFVEQFALETFQRADGAIRSNRATAQTVDTFQAAATFLDLMGIWGELEPDIAQKSKYSKYHAIRIAKALKAGEDPNESNPTPEPEPSAEVPFLDPNDPEVQRINGGGPSYQPTVESAPESSRTSPAFMPRHPSTQGPPSPMLPNQPAFSPNAQAPSQPFQPGDVSPISAPDDSRKGSVASIGGGYFPRMGTFTAEQGPSLVQSAPIDDINMTVPSFVPSPVTEAQNFYTNPPSQPPVLPQQPSFQPQPSPQHHMSTPPPVFPPQPPQQSFQPSVASPPQQPLSAPIPQQLQPPTHFNQQPTAPPPPPGGYRTDDASINEAQKHARYAMSALAFDDVATAVKELRIALRELGAS